MMIKKIVQNMQNQFLTYNVLFEKMKTQFYLREKRLLWLFRIGMLACGAYISCFVVAVYDRIWYDCWREGSNYFLVFTFTVDSYHSACDRVLWRPKQ